MGKGQPKTPDYASASSTNPYVVATASKDGTSYSLNSFLTSQNKFVENNLPNLYSQLLNPDLNNPIAKARQDSFNRQFKESSQKAYETGISNLSKRGLLRSSAVNDMAKNLTKQQNEQLAEFQNQQLSNSINDTQSLISTLLNQYLLGANLGQQAISNAQNSVSSINAHNLKNYANDVSGYISPYSYMNNALSTMGYLAKFGG